MRSCLVFLVCLSLSPLWATNYYLSVEGDDGQVGTSADQAWQTIDRLNQASAQLAPGDSVLFHRGQVFPGQLQLSRGGLAGQPIVLAAYGSGTEPVISGSVKVGSWSKKADGIWATRMADSVVYLFVNSKRQTLARFPNQGFLRNLRGTRFSARAKELADRGEDYWAGGFARMRTTDWTWEFARIQHSDEQGLLSFADTNKYPLKGGWGFFVDNLRSELDAEGEWYYDGPQQTLYWKPPSHLDPNQQDIRASVYANGILGSKPLSHLQIHQLHFRDQYEDGIRLTHRRGEGITIRDCRFSGQGKSGVDLSGKNIALTGCRFEQILGNAIKGFRLDQARFEHNQIQDIGLEPGFGLSGNQGMNGIHLRASKACEVNYNRLINIGYTGISGYVNHSQISCNVIKNTCLRLNDGGGIYGWGKMTHHNEISDNIILNVQGNTDGIPKSKIKTHGIYLDFRCSYVNVLRNTVRGAGTTGIFVNSANHHHLVQANILIDNGREQLSLAEARDQGKTVANLFQENLCFSAQTPARCVRVISSFGTEQQMGVFKKNILINQETTQMIEIGTYQNREQMNLTTWEGRYPSLAIQNTALTASSTEVPTVILNESAEPMAYELPQAAYSAEGELLARKGSLAPFSCLLAFPTELARK